MSISGTTTFTCALGLPDVMILARRSIGSSLSLLETSLWHNRQDNKEGGLYNPRPRKSVPVLDLIGRNQDDG